MAQSVKCLPCEREGLRLSSGTHVLDGLHLSSQRGGGRNRRVPGAHQPTILAPGSVGDPISNEAKVLEKFLSS